VAIEAASGGGMMHIALGQSLLARRNDGDNPPGWALRNDSTSPAERRNGLRQNSKIDSVACRVTRASVHSIIYCEASCVPGSNAYIEILQNSTGSVL
jgi:hypothetical protein